MTVIARQSESTHRVGRVTAAVAEIEMRPLALTVEKSAAVLGVSRGTVYSLLHTKQIRGVLANGRRLIPVSELEAFIARQLADSEDA